MVIAGIANRAWTPSAPSILAGTQRSQAQREQHMDERKRIKTWSPFTLSLPPAEQTLLGPWLEQAAVQMGSQVPSLTGHVRLQVRIGLVDVDGLTLGQIIPAIVALLAGEN